MRRYFIPMLIFLILGLGGCGVNASEVEKLLVLSRGPFSEYSSRAYEIQFAEDGLICSIRQFHLTGEIDPYKWDNEQSNARQEIEYYTEITSDGVTLFQVDETGNTTTFYSFETARNGSIKFVGTQSEYTLLRESASKFRRHRSDGTLIDIITLGGSEITREFNNNGKMYRFVIEGNQLRAMIVGGKGYAWNADITFDGRNKYTIVAPDLQNEAPFANEVIVVSPRIVEFSIDAAIMNSFILLAIENDDRDYMLPFVTRQMIP